MARAAVRAASRRVEDPWTPMEVGSHDPEGFYRIFVRVAGREVEVDDESVKACLAGDLDAEDLVGRVADAIVSAVRAGRGAASH
ncbi:hypothetical protein [Brachybacterium kimchii]|uniref:Uncharacterized protein n=1 Tax=Brachybacterium kimchii TaxID=2942909 RepID=A0ABY4ND99_9MICO|nr:hypothetical protein [Brachybacterium kimchii]UQN31525.1 hypothetical protein M4486_09725 [Brachybacterium kimchii]